jgi:Gpi18-like mannosyltransferase
MARQEIKWIVNSIPKPLRGDFFTLLIIFVVWVIAIVNISYWASNELYGIRDFQTKEILEANKLERVHSPEILEGLIRWDAAWYLDIAINGYHKVHPTDTPGVETNRQTAFFPLYPALIKTGMKLGLSPVWAAVGINIILSFGALILIYLISLEWLKERKLAMRTALLFLFFPSSFFLISPYSEALFCFLSFGAFYFALRKNWLTANIFLAFCTLSRSAGLIVALCIFLLYLRNKNYRLSNIDRSIFTFLLAPLGLIAYMIYLWHNFGNPLLMLESQKYWAQSINPNIFNTFWDKTVDVFRAAITPGYNAFGGDYGKEWINILTYGSFVVFGAVSVWGIIRKQLIFPLALYVLFSLLFFISKGNFISVNRYVLPLFPVFILLALYTRKSEHLFSLLLAASATVMSFVLIQFAISYWAG